ncbi:hypothetical protein [Candidatus Synechococcus spongiarum]|uniref:hypothetical protein n=1 Tax=Candidatus Synechococcus spongiarum TaxID=431041 RepID=UPI001C5A8F55|nr:hypothetical protein [Candidatus Synechococcus spongiarum]
MDLHSTRHPRNEADATETTCGDGRTAADGGLLELPLQEHHHQIVSAFMEEYQCDPSSEGFRRSSRRPDPHALRRLAVRLRSWWAQRKAPPSAPPQE